MTTETLSHQVAPTSISAIVLGLFARFFARPVDAEQDNDVWTSGARGL